MEDNEGKIETGVEGVYADDTYDNSPVFDVDSEEFFNNMRRDRNKMQFTTSEKPSKFMNATSHRDTFYMRYNDPKSGEQYLKKVK